MSINRTEMFIFRLTPGELQLVKKAAEVAGVRPSEWARQLIIASATTIAANPESAGIELSLTSTGQVKYVTVGK